MQTQSFSAVAAELQLAVDERDARWTSAHWRDYFRHHAANLIHIPWRVAMRLMGARRHRLPQVSSAAPADAVSTRAGKPPVAPQADPDLDLGGSWLEL